MSAEYASKIFSQHADLLRASGISLDVARERGYVSVDRKAHLERLGFTPSQRRVPGLLLPVKNVRGETALHQYRPDEPRERDGKMVKYETPRSARMVLDVPPRVRGWLDDPQVPLLITEGIRKADAAASAGLCCVALLGVWNWRGTNQKGGKTALACWESVALDGRRVLLAFDSDVTVKPEVRAALVRLKEFLAARGASVEVVYLPHGDGGAKTGLDDYLAAGHGLDDLLALAHPELPPEPESAKPKPTTSANVPEESGRVLLDLVSRAYRRYVVMTQEQADAEALWVLHCHLIHIVETTPYIWIRSAERRSGKTRNLKVTTHLVPRAEAAANLTDAALFRTITEHGPHTPPTILIDECDAIFFQTRNGESRPELRGLLNAGYERGPLSEVPRVEGEGANREVKRFSTFSPKILAGIRDLPDTVADRCIMVELRRKLTSEKTTPYRRRRTPKELEPLYERLAAWGERNAERVAALIDQAGPDYPNMPGLNDRLLDVWEILCAIADVVGGEWPERARRAAVALSGEAAEMETESPGVRLLRDISGVFAEKGVERLPSDELAAALAEIESAPWGEWRRGKPITTIALAAQLRPYKIAADRWRDGREQVRGYHRSSFEDAWKRYTPEHSDSTRHGDTNGVVEPETADPDSSHESAVRRVENAGFPDNEAVCDGVTSQNAETGPSSRADDAPEPEAYERVFAMAEELRFPRIPIEDTVVAGAVGWFTWTRAMKKAGEEGEEQLALAERLLARVSDGASERSLFEEQS